MRIGDKSYRSIWYEEENPGVIRIINQERIPFSFEIEELRSVEDVYNAISSMMLRGAPVIGAAGAFGIHLAALEITGLSEISEHLSNAARYLVSSRPTAVNLSWAVTRVMKAIEGERSIEEITRKSLAAAIEIYGSELENCRQIGLNGVGIIEEISRRKGGAPVNILTHCNAGWLACIDYGTVTAPIYLARDRGIPVHVWVDETRPRNQGARITAYELANEKIPHTLITDNAGGHLMQKGLVDLVIAGSDRTTRMGDVANKIGTYLKAVAARDNGIPFYVALPSSSIDFTISDGLSEIVIEERDPSEVTEVTGMYLNKIASVRICPEETRVSNPGFDITPARLVTGLITERGICGANESELIGMFPDKEI